MHIRKTKKSGKWVHHMKEITDSAIPERVIEKLAENFVGARMSCVES